jgi:hypothetical protein
MVSRATISYGVLCDHAGVPWLVQSLKPFLCEIAAWCAEKDWPPLNALPVRSDTHMPGDGYDDAAGCSLITWADEVRRCIAFRGYPPSDSI